MESKRLALKDVATLREHLHQALDAQLIVPMTGTSAPLAYRGNGREIPSTWNVLIYHPKRKGPVLDQAVVCTDFEVLRTLWREDYEALTPSDKEPIYIDDAGWGFPLLGVMVGVNRGKRVMTRMVDVQHFQPPNMERKTYLAAFAKEGVALLRELGATPEKHRIEICTGYVNGALRETLREQGWEVKVAAIEGLLQDKLEEEFALAALDKLDVDLYYDPKELSGKEIAKRYREAVAFGREHCPQLLKTGWKSLQTTAAK